MPAYPAASVWWPVAALRAFVGPDAPRSKARAALAFWQHRDMVAAEALELALGYFEADAPNLPGLDFLEETGTPW